MTRHLNDDQIRALVAAHLSDLAIVTDAHHALGPDSRILSQEANDQLREQARDRLCAAWDAWKAGTL